jgi:kynurenine formamidase
MAREIPSEADVRAWVRTLSNWGRWGAEDELGTLNFLTPAKRREAAALVREGVSVACARPIGYEPAPEQRFPLRHFVRYREAGERDEYRAYYDDFLIGPHGLTVTHLDGLSHIAWEGQLYNGRPAQRVDTYEGATVLAIDSIPDGVVTRGVLLDIPGLSGREWLEADEAIFPEDLEAAEARQGVRTERGDALLVYCGHTRRLRIQGAAAVPPPRARPGLHAACLPWLHAREVALIGSDTTNEVLPTGYAMERPIHAVAIVGMGLWLLDNCDLEALAAACTRYERWAFQFLVAPLKLRQGTGSPVNPLAVF